MRWLVLLGVGWGQTTFWVEGSVGGLHRIPVAKKQPWLEVSRAAGGDRRQPGPSAGGGWALRYLYHPKRFVEVGMKAFAASLREGERYESFTLASVPLRAGWRLDTTARPWWFWSGIAASLLLRAHSRPEISAVYRFQDYFARSQLHLEMGLERTLTPRWQAGIGLRWDLTPAWDKVLFQASRTLAYHLSLSLYARYRLWGPL